MKNKMTLDEAVAVLKQYEETLYNSKLIKIPKKEQVQAISLITSFIEAVRSEPSGDVVKAGLKSWKVWTSGDVIEMYESFRAMIKQAEKEIRFGD